jgi:NAD(P)H-dependent FMN reductase
MKKLFLISGSQRRDSINTQLLHYLARVLTGRFSLDLLQSDSVDLPLFNQDLEESPALIRRVSELHLRIKECHGLVVASPEYNGQVSPFLKNTIDWISRLAYLNCAFDNPFLDKPVLLCSASTGAGGGALGIQSARALFAYVGSLVTGDAICLPFADQLLGQQGFDLPPHIEEQIEFSVTRFVRIVCRQDNSEHDACNTPIAELAV